MTGALWVDVERGAAGWGDRLLPLTSREVAVLAVLADAGGRVVPRRELARRSGLFGGSPRRCEAALVGLRRVLGPDAVHNVRGRGWSLDSAAACLPADRA